MVGVSPRFVDWHRRDFFKREGFLGVDDSGASPSDNFGSGEEMGEGEEAEEAFESARLGPGRPRVEDAQPALLTFLDNFVQSRGQVSRQDKGRLRDTLEVFGAPLTDPEAAQKQIGSASPRQVAKQADDRQTI